MKVSELLEASRIFSGVRLDEIPVKYKHLKVLGRGATTIALEKDHETVLLFTRDSIKAEWLSRTWGLQIAKYIDEYESHKHTIPGVREIPIQILEMPKLYPLNLENKRLVFKLMKEFDEVRSGVVSVAWGNKQTNKNREMIISYQKILDKYEEDFHDDHQFKVLLDFLSNYDENQYDWDLGPRNFKQDINSKLILLDPIVDKGLLQLYHDSVRQNNLRNY